MDLQMLAQNIRRLRNAKHLSQKELAEKAGLSLPSIKNLELAKGEPRMRTIQAISKVLDVKVQEFFWPVSELRTVRFRSVKRMQNRENILATITKKIKDFNYLEEILNYHIPFNLKKIIPQCRRDNIIETANLCRKKLGLKPHEPIHDICGLLEKAGVKVLFLPMSSDGFFGLSIGEKDGGPAVAVNVWERIPVERRIFSAAHEFGHIMLHPDAFDIDLKEENKDEEAEANLFAGHFLLPDDGFREEWNDASGLHFVDRVFKIKRIFRVSYKAILYRLTELNFADKSIWPRFNSAYQQKFHKSLPYTEEPMGIDSSEPYGLKAYDFFEDCFSRLVRLAIEKDKISLSRGAEMLGISLESMQNLLKNWEVIL
ncbi:MAG: ImmA/IrrE family metallo-endopeptidase [Desulfatirhabdiaceae bacterium]